jgi:eukaryotic-like serine/threonine-protein kinase
MLDADATDDDALERAVGQAMREVAAGTTAPLTQRLGPYRVIAEIGQGGMGTVYLAERADGTFDQQVAIKVVRGLLDQDRVRRFRAERQILASLQHPNIARLIDGGTTDEGWPYLVMEYVDGVPIDTYVTTAGLSLDARLRLFLIVCDAVGHAHRHLVVHRDIKPSNILVARDGTPRLLDFGIAKLLDEDETAAAAARTLTGMRMLTPDYASPEQVRGEPVTTATDVYALGVLLFELLTGQRPHRFKTLTAQEIERVVCDTDAPRPSTLATGLPEDLDIIVGAALHKERARRYPSVEALEGDLRRYLDGRPVQARPATWRYRARRFTARHRWGVATAALFVALLVAFSVTVTIQAARIARERDLAQQQRDAAEQVSSFLVGLFEVSDPSESRGATVTARELLERGAEQVERGLASQPTVQSRLMDTIGRVYRQLGLFPEAEDLLTKALAAREAAATGPSDDVADSLEEMGNLLRERGQHQQALTMYERSLAMRRQLHAEPHLAIAASLDYIGLALQSEGRFAEAESQLRAGLAMRRALLPAGDQMIGRSLNNLGLLLRVARIADAEPVLKEALDIRRAAFPSAHPLLSNSLMQYGQLLDQLGRYDEAEPHMREALAMRISIYGPDHFIVGTSYNNLASLLHNMGAYDRAEEMYRAALAIGDKVFGRSHPESAVTLNNLASLLEDKGDPAAAVPMFREALAIRRHALGETHAAVGRGMNNLARALAATGQYAEAGTLAERALAIRRGAFGADHVEVAGSLGLLARVRSQTGRLDEAVALSADALAMLRRVLPAQHPSIATALLAHGQLLVTARRTAEAEPLVREAVQIRQARLPAGHAHIAQAEQAWAALTMTRP